MKRTDLLGLLAFAGYHDDTRTWVRLYVENHVSLTVAKQQWLKGQAWKHNGERCSCYNCKAAAS